MSFTTSVKQRVNALLSRANLRIDSLTAERLERQRLERLAAASHFERPVFPVSPAFRKMNGEPVLAAVAEYAARLAHLESPELNDVGYSFTNSYFGSPDAEVLYAVVRHFRPARIVEVGSGHSTKVSRQAILDGCLATRLTCVDPQPRSDVAPLADQFYDQPVETLVNHPLFASLEPGDILFIDSSHQLCPGNDCVALFLQVLPQLDSGVLVHVHDVFLPYDYPREWVMEKRWPWNEQYLVQALLMHSDAFDVLWAGHFLQRTHPHFASRFPRIGSQPATSLWLRKISQTTPCSGFRVSGATASQ